jgi:predicted nuclease of predicted toxin-antitoxin system
LEWAADEGRVLLTIDRDFGEILFVEGASHCGLVRFPDVPAVARIRLMQQVLEQHEQEIMDGAIITIRGGRIRISRTPA